jgi:hypothetical protein
MAPPNPDIRSRIDRWNDMPMSITNQGALATMISDPCHPSWPDVSLEFPAESGQIYGENLSLWVGALIDSDGFSAPRVSVALDGWFSVNEFFPGENSPIEERSDRDTVNCFGSPIFNSDAVADHEYTATFSDTMTDAFWVDDDPVDGPHRPLGVEVMLTTYSYIDPPCRRIYWIRYHIANIGDQLLKNLYVGTLLDVGVLQRSESPAPGDDFCGFNAVHDFAYWHDNDGRAAGDSSGDDFTVPNVVGMCYLNPILDQRTSFNWWVSDGESQYDFGPSWEDHCSSDSLAWTAIYGTPVGDLHKYQIMSNGETDYDYVYYWNSWTPPDSDLWCPTPPDSRRESYEPRMLYSFGPLGIPWYQDANNRWVYRLSPGESIDVWAAIASGVQFHTHAHPQPHSRPIDPSLYDFSLIEDHMDWVHGNLCLNWTGADIPKPPVPQSFSFNPIYPNPFNSSARIAFMLPLSNRVVIKAYDVLGRQAASIADQVYAPGAHDLDWNAEGLASGIYFVQAKVNGQVLATQKAVLLK